MKKIPRTAKMSPICLSEELFEFNYFKLDKHLVLFLIANEPSEQRRSDGEAAAE